MRKYELLINGKKYDVEIQSFNNGVATVLVNGISYQVEVLGEQVQIITPRAYEAPPAPATMQSVQPEATVAPQPAPSARPVSTPKPAASTSRSPTAAPSRAASAPAALKAGAGAITAPMPGLILETKVNAGDMVKRGDVVVRMEAMKMENDILATRDGVVSKVHVEKGMEVQTGQVLVTIGE